MPDQRQPRRPEPDWDFEFREDNPKRYMAVVRAPWWNRKSKSVEQGAHCLACRYQLGHPDALLHWKHEYTMTTFGKHLQYCKMIGYKKHNRLKSLLGNHKHNSKNSCRS